MLAGYRVPAALVPVALTVNAARAADPPRMQVDPFWPKPPPNNWILGQVAGVAVDPQDHVWIIQRPRSLTPDERGAFRRIQRLTPWLGAGAYANSPER
jgi:hypothetical protein